LDGRKADFTDNIAVPKSENSFHLIEGDTLLYANHVLVKSWTLSARKLDK
jgi:hypothetical protein